MYKSFRVKNFRCFKDLQINDLGRVNLIAGKNNTGKTALMEAMYIHSGNRDIRTLLRTSRAAHSRVLPDGGSNAQPTDNSDAVGWSIAFRDFDTAHEILLSADIQNQQTTLFGPTEEESVAISVKSADSDDYVATLDKFRIDEFDLLKDTEVLEFDASYDSVATLLLYLQGRVRSSRIRNKALLPSDFMFAMEKPDSRALSSQYSDIRKTKPRTWFTDKLTIIEPDLKDVEILLLDGRLALHAEVGLSQLLPFTSLGDGTNRFASMVLSMTELEHGVIFIDEIENGIHHSVHCKVWQAIGRVARELDIQVFATTHSLEMIRAAYEAFSADDALDDFRYHRLDRSRKTGGIKATTYNELDMEAVAAFDFDHEVR